MNHKEYTKNEDKLKVGCNTRKMTPTEIKYNKKYQLRSIPGTEQRPIFCNMQRTGKKMIYFVEERDLIGTITLTLILLRDTGYLKSKKTFKLIDELGHLLALQKVGWDWYDNCRQNLNTISEGPNYEANPPGFMGAKPEEMFGYRSDNPIRDRKRCYEIIFILMNKIQILNEML